MIPPIYPLLKNAPAVTALLGNDILRVYPWGEAPEDTPKPYATYGIFNGVPENYLNQVPDVDNLGSQIDIWAETLSSCNNCFLAIRQALEPHAHLTAFEGSERDRETGLYRCRMDFDFFKER